MLNERPPEVEHRPKNGRRLPRVYHFILDHRVGGPHVYVDTLRNALAGKVETTIATTGRGPVTDVALLNLRHFWAPLYALEMVANALFLVGAVLLRHIRRRDVVFNVHGSANLAPIVAARIVGIPVVWHFHETTPRFRRLVTVGRWVLSGHPHSLVVVADKAKEAYSLEDAILIPAVVDTNFWSRDKVGQEEVEACGWSGSTACSERPFRILVVGNLNPLKGVDILLEAMAEMDGPWHLKIVGSELDTHREYARILFQRANEISSQDERCIVDFLGWQEKIQVRTLLASCDVYVLPSRSEACPIALLEAMAMGCRCVAADVGDVSTMMESYSGGHVFPNGSVVGLRQGIDLENLRKDPALEVMLGNASQLLAFSGKLLLIYSGLLDKS